MQFRRNFLNLFVFICLLIFISASFAQQSVVQPLKPVTVNANQPLSLSFPYFAVVTGDNVNIRSGPGTNYYSCGKLNRNDKVKIVSRQFMWARIVPPPGSFSWISKKYVNIDPNNSTVGVVTDENVRIWAGSEQYRPMYSDKLQTKLNKGEKVTLLGDEQDDYYKIAPPDGVYLWVNSQYTKPMTQADEAVLSAKPLTATQPEATSVVPTKISVETEKLTEFYILEKQIDAERKKPFGKQSYTVFKNSLREIADNNNAGKAARYARFTLEKIKRFEFALKVAQELKLQNDQLQQAKERIEKARLIRLSQIVDLGKFVAIGKFETSSIYGVASEPEHYRIVDNTGKTICYAMPTGLAENINLTELIGKKVGLIGTIEPFRQVGGARVQFTEITEVK